MQKVEKHHLKDYDGSFLYLGAAMDKLSEQDPTRLLDPSLGQIRGAVTEFCVLPLGSQAVWDHSPLKSVVKGADRVNKPATPTLLCGSPGTGKKMLVHAICNETGANLFNLTPSNTEGKYPGKKAYDMVYTVLKVARALGSTTSKRSSRRARKRAAAATRPTASTRRASSSTWSRTRPTRSGCSTSTTACS